jgi:hypothetical protein
MKFFSKQAVYRLVLDRGIQENKLTGQPPVPGLYILFQDGMANVEDENIIQRLTNHPLYGKDFTSENAEGSEKIKSTSSIEPGHVIQEMKYGTVDKVVSSKPQNAFTPEMMSLLTEMARSMATEMVKTMSKPEVSDSAQVTPSNPSQVSEPVVDEVDPEIDQPEEEINSAPDDGVSMTDRQ